MPPRIRPKHSSRASTSATPPPSPDPEHLQLFENAMFQPECIFDIAGLEEHPDTEFALHFFRSNSLDYFLDPPTPYAPIYLDLLYQFYCTLRQPKVDHSRTYHVDLYGTHLTFEDCNLCQVVGGPESPIPLSFAYARSMPDIIQELFQGYTIPNWGLSSNRAHLSRHMWLVDNIVKCNMYPQGHKIERKGRIVKVLDRIHRGEWFDVGRVMFHCMLATRANILRDRRRSQKLFFPHLITLLLQHKGYQFRDGERQVLLPMKTYTKASFHISWTSLSRIGAPRAPLVEDPQAADADTDAPPVLPTEEPWVPHLHRVEEAV